MLPSRHPASILEIDLGAIVANWNKLRAQHRSGPVAGVVKADGYGLGAPPVAEALYAAGCRHFFVALLDEALEIRRLVPGALVAVLGGPIPGSEPDYLQCNITPVLGSLAELDAWTATARKAGRKLPAILHIDTGMSRLGFAPRELKLLQLDHARLDGVALAYVMTHFVASEEHGNPLNALQLRRFAAACAGLPPAPRSVANSSGIYLRGVNPGSDLARPGAALYGLNPAPYETANPMTPVVRLKTRVLAVREIPAGASVGYNATWRAERRCRIATAAIGYADGLHRSLSNQGRAFFDGTPVPLVGRVSMDLTTFDVSKAPGVEPGAWLDLLGPEQTPDDLAVAAGTNGYEVLTSLGRRFHRVYKSA